MTHPAPPQGADQQSPQYQVPQQGQPIDHRNAKAEAKAAKAYAKATRPWFKKKRFIFPLALIVLFAIGSQLGGGEDGTAKTAGATDSSSDSNTKQDEAAPAVEEDVLPGIGDKVRDGKFLFTVTKVKRGVQQVGSDTFGVKAQGQFVLVTMTVKNIGDEAQTLFGDNQTLFIGGKKYSADTEAGIYLDESKSFIEEINPGNKLTGTVVFDVPKNAKALEKIEVHDSAFSGGADIDLSKS